MNPCNHKSPLETLSCNLCTLEYSQSDWKEIAKLAAYNSGEIRNENRIIFLDETEYENEMSEKGDDERARDQLVENFEFLARRLEDSDPAEIVEHLQNCIDELRENSLISW